MNEGTQNLFDNNSDFEINEVSHDVNDSFDRQFFETEYFANEPLIQDVVRTTSSAQVQCHQLFDTLLEQSSLSKSDQKIVQGILRKSFGQITECHDLKTGVFRSKYTRHKLYRSNPKYVKPVKVKICDKQGNDSGYHYSYVAPLEILKVMLEDDDVRQLIDTEEVNPDENGIFDIKDGEIFKKNKFFIINKDGLIIIVFQDAFDVCNPIGPSKSKFKMVGVYMMLGNLPARHRSKVNNIKFVLLCFEEYINQFGWDEILDRFIADMLVLGTVEISYSVSGTVQTRKGTVTAGVGDNLGSHDLGGLSRNFSKVQYFSRYCESTPKELRENGFITGKMRTIQSYDEDANIALRTGQIYKGIRCHSALNKLNWFHVGKSGLPPCIAHDVFEGVAPSDLFLAFEYFVEKNNGSSTMSDEPHFLKVWSSDRSKKRIATIFSPDIQTALDAANAKLGTRGTCIVLEADGTELDDGRVLKKFKDDVMMVLAAEEEWHSSTGSPKAQHISTTPLQNIDMNSFQTMLLVILDPTANTTPSLDLSNNSVEENPEQNGENIEHSEDSTSAQTSESNKEQSSSDNQSETSDLIKKTLSMGNIDSWEDFTVHWENFCPSILQNLENNDRSQYTINKSVEYVMDQMRFYSSDTQRPQCVDVAKMMVAKYPNTFEDRKEDGTRLGNGYGSLVKKMQSYHGNFKRAKPKTVRQTLGIEFKDTKQTGAIRAGCPNWQLEFPPEHDAESLELIRVKLLGYKSSSEYPEDEVLKDFKIFFAYQRYFLNNHRKKVTATDVFLNWLILFESSSQLTHFDYLTGKGANQMLVRFKNDLDAVLPHGSRMKKPINAPDNASDEEKNTTAIKIIFAHSDEEYDTIFKEFNNLPNEIPEMNHPFILKSIIPSLSYSLIVDGCEVNTSPGIIHALAVLVTSYFVYNRPYPKESPCFLEYCQMRYFDIVLDKPPYRSKNQKKVARAETLYSKVSKIKKVMEDVARNP
ncbi:hypothetical protein QAD02_002879 [Eretmocerus hayati]|uniref:Uncharacterized protein n=1 Tax=Eretmocerus hayati TaxID=131215 RepID=A0ACC2NK47_9HYME|nr:hypothetical protein QAD02_002879 [Eretmocerus hayati]